MLTSEMIVGEKPGPLVLIVDDVTEDRQTLRRYLTRASVPTYRIAEAPTLAKAMDLVKRETPACVILDFNLPDGDGLELLRRLVAAHAPQAFGVIMLTGSGEASVAVEAMKSGAHDYVEKNALTPSGLRRAVANAIEKAGIQRQLAAQARELALKNEELAKHVAQLEHEVGERVRTQGALTQSESFLQSIIGAHTDCVNVLDMEGRLTWMNDNGKVMMEIADFSAWCDVEWTGLWPEGDVRQEVEAAMQQAREGRIGRFTAFGPTAKGTPKWWDVIVTPIFGSSRKPEKLLSVSRDVTKARRAEQIVQETATQLRAVTDHIPISIAQFDRNYRYRFANQHFTARFGLTPDSIIGKSIVDVIGEDAFKQYRPQMDVALTGKQVDFETAGSYGGQHERWYRVTYIPERNAAGEVIGFVAVSADITERKRAETEISRARDEAVDATRARDSFLAALSHELRTPLNPVLLVASEAADNLSLPSSVRDDFTSIRDHVELEARLIDDLLDLSRISHGKLKLDRRRMGLHGALQNAIATVKPDIDEKNITLQVSLEAEEPLVNADTVRLQQVFWNVLKNAVKFTPAGGHVTLVSTVDATQRMARISVTDSGIGMTVAELPKIFDAFSQGEHAQTGSIHRFGGLGLGLAITRMLVEAHGGKIAAQSEGPNKGSTFTVELPLAMPVAPTMPAGAKGMGVKSMNTELTTGAGAIKGTSGERAAATIVGLSEVTKGSAQVLPAAAGTAVGLLAGTGAKLANKGRILLIEDHAPTRASLSAVLGRRGFQVVVAATVAEAQEQARKYEIDLVISDIGLPDGDGYQCMQMLQELKPGLPGIALSGYGMEEDIARSRLVGFSEHLIKPVNVNALDRAVAKVLSGELNAAGAGS
jgi:PAS domain S-box-containing protein